MKKLSYIISGLLMLGSSAICSSCGDNDDFWGPHTLTDAEIAEIARQDSIKEAQRNSINADLILEYTAEFYMSNTSYDGTSIQIDMDQIAQLFGLSKDEVGAALNGEGDADVKGFAIEGSTHADNGTSSNTNYFWGHWWDPNGDVMDYKQGPAVFAEFWYEDGVGTFNVGQYPGHLVANQQIKFIEAIKYQDKRVAIVITAIARERGEVKATIVATNNLTLETSPNDAYAAVEVPDFDAAAALSALGAGSWADVDWVCTNADGSYAQEYNADPAPAFWFDKEGFYGSWGDNASVFAFFDAESGTINIGQMPGNMTEGSTVTINFSAIYNNKIVENVITVNIVGYEDPETAPEGEPASIEKDITLTKAYDADWGATEEFDVKEDLRQAFKMTTYQIFSALKSGEMNMWVGEVGADADEEGNAQYTADAPGYWLGAEGQRVTWGDEAIVYLNLGISEESLAFYSGNHPDNCSPAGQTVVTKMILEKDGITATFNITIDVTPAE